MHSLRKGLGTLSARFLVYRLCPAWGVSLRQATSSSKKETVLGRLVWEEGRLVWECGGPLPPLSVRVRYERQGVRHEVYPDSLHIALDPSLLSIDLGGAAGFYWDDDNIPPQRRRRSPTLPASAEVATSPTSGTAGVSARVAVAAPSTASSRRHRPLVPPVASAAVVPSPADDTHPHAVSETLARVSSTPPPPRTFPVLPESHAPAPVPHDLPLSSGTLPLTPAPPVSLPLSTPLALGSVAPRPTPQAEPVQCRALLKDGSPCYVTRNLTDGLCRLHRDSAPAPGKLSATPHVFASPPLTGSVAAPSAGSRSKAAVSVLVRENSEGLALVGEVALQAQPARAVRQYQFRLPDPLAPLRAGASVHVGAHEDDEDWAPEQ